MAIFYSLLATLSTFKSHTYTQLVESSENRRYSYNSTTVFVIDSEISGAGESNSFHH